MFGETKAPPHLRESGQAVIEYIALLAVVVSIILVLARALKDIDLDQRFHDLVTENFRNTYRYGNPKVKGADDPGGPDNHPRFAGDGNFRIFLNPGENQ